MGYQSDYARTVADIYSQLGQGQAQARLQQGSAWANAFGQIGQTAAAIPGQIAEKKQQDRRNALTDLQMEEARRNVERSKQQDAETSAISRLIAQSTVNGTLDQKVLRQAAGEMGMAHVVEKVTESFVKTEQAMLALEASQFSVAEKQRTFFAVDAPDLVAWAFDPTFIKGLLEKYRVLGVPEPWVKALESMPTDQFIATTMSLLPKPEPIKVGNQQPGDVFSTQKIGLNGVPKFDPEGNPIMVKVSGAGEKPNPVPTFRVGVVDGKSQILQWNPKTNQFDPTNASPIPPSSRGGGLSGRGDSDEDAIAEGIAEGIISGRQPPVLTGLYRNAARVRAILEKRGYNLANAVSDWTATQKFLGSANSVKQTALRQAVETAYHSLDVIDDLASKWKGVRFPVLNKVNLLAATNGAYGPDVQSVATQLQAQITDLTSELGQVYMGGNSPTDHALELASKNLSATWSEKVLKDMTELARRNLTIRQNSLTNARPVGTGANPYTEPTTTPAKMVQTGEGGLATTPPPDQLGGWKWNGQTWVKR